MFSIGEGGGTAEFDYLDEYDGIGSSSSDSNVVYGFDLDNTCEDGRVALVYINGSEDPEIWFQDLGCEWSYLASTFSDYYRLVVTHIGIPRWQVHIYKG